MTQIFSTLVFLMIAAGGIGVIAAMIGDNLGAIRVALVGGSDIPRVVGTRSIRVATRRSPYRVAAHLPEARRAA